MQTTRHKAHAMPYAMPWGVHVSQQKSKESKLNARNETYVVRKRRVEGQVATHDTAIDRRACERDAYGVWDTQSFQVQPTSRCIFEDALVSGVVERFWKGGVVKMRLAKRVWIGIGIRMAGWWCGGAHNIPAIARVGVGGVSGPHEEGSQWASWAWTGQCLLLRNVEN